MQKWKSLGVGALCALFLMSFSAFAQSDVASISGFVRDSSGSVVPNAKVTVKNEAVDIERTINTNSEGYYVVSAFPRGFIRYRPSRTGSRSLNWFTRNSIPVFRRQSIFR